MEDKKGMISFCQKSMGSIETKLSVKNIERERDQNQPQIFHFLSLFTIITHYWIFATYKAWKVMISSTRAIWKKNNNNK